MALQVSCESRISSVVVYARGAIVTRSVSLPGQLPSEAVDLVIPAVTPAAEPGGIRASADGSRQVVGLRSRIVVPDSSAGGGELREKLRTLEHQRDTLVALQQELARRRRALVALQPRLALHGRARRADPAGRISDALALDDLASDLCREIESRMAETARAVEDVSRRVAAAQEELNQARTAQAAIAAHPVREVTVSLAPGAGALSSLEISYAVGAARWWPAYSARIGASGSSASLSLEAFVAQSSFEDWQGARLGLCTGDMIRDARLPELPSLRLGRAQPPKKSGFRAPPEGLDALFSGYDQAMLPPAFPSGTPAGAGGPADFGAVTFQGLKQDELQAAEEPPEPELGLEEDEASAFTLSEDAKVTVDRIAVASTIPPPAAAAPADPNMMPQKSANRPAPKPMPQEHARQEPMRGHRGGRRSATGEFRTSGGAGVVTKREDGGAFHDADSDADLALEPADAWLDFDSLAMAGGEEGRRGRLVRSEDPRGSEWISRAASLLSGEPRQAADPLSARGSFDHRFDAEGGVDVPSNGQPHRVALCSAQAQLSRRFRTVPREGAEVYREAHLSNPFPAPLLGGPVDVFLDGALISSDALTPVDRGGTVVLGLGVEERLRVARNLRADEAAKGLMGGTTAVEHLVTVEIASALGLEAEVEVLERIPVSDEKDLEVTLLSSKPQAEVYKQAERGSPVRGGLRQVLKVPAGGKAVAELCWRLTLPSKLEIVGGNRRD